MPEPAANPVFRTAYRSLAGLALLLSIACLQLPAQDAPSRPARAEYRGAAAASGLYRIAGTVVNSATGEPVRRATVAILAEADSHTVESVASDSEGRFALERLPAGKYQLTASKRGFRTAFYDEHEEFSTAIVTGPDLNANLDTGHLTFRLTPAAVLRGVVSTDGGDPVEGARVMIFEQPRRDRPGVHILQVDAVNTDDTGAYEFPNLAAGSYLLAVTAEPWYALHSGSGARRKQANEDSTALDVAYPVTYYDSTTDEASATPVVLTGGSREEADINLHAVPALRLSIATPRKADGSVARPELRQSIFGAQIATDSAGSLDALRSGTTEFNGVAPGRYELTQGDPPRVVDLDATASQQVDPDAGTPTFTVAGTLRGDSGSTVRDELNLTLDMVDGGHGQSQFVVAAHKGRFSFDAVPPGSWLLGAESGGKLLPVISIASGGAVHQGNLLTVRDRPLSLAVTVSEGATRIEGFARKDGKGFAGAMVVLAPKDAATWQALTRRDQSDSDGSFALRDIAPGQYTVVAIQDGWELDWSRPEALGRYLQGGTAITVTGRSGDVVRLTQAVTVQPR
jgi:uncharacterized surface anchored protein